jgi:uncharacterized protein
MILCLNKVMLGLGMIDGEKEEIQHEAVVCRKSYWLYAQSSGILRVFPNLTDSIKKGDRIALISDVYGEVIEEILAPADAIVVAKATDPVCHVGARVIHLGLIWDDYENVSN